MYTDFLNLIFHICLQGFLSLCDGDLRWHPRERERHFLSLTNRPPFFKTFFRHLRRNDGWGLLVESRNFAHRGLCKSSKDFEIEENCSRLFSHKKAFELLHTHSLFPFKKRVLNSHISLKLAATDLLYRGKGGRRERGGNSTADTQTHCANTDRKQ